MSDGTALAVLAGVILALVLRAFVSPFLTRKSDDGQP
jgi:hypothetical protein